MKLDNQEWLAEPKTKRLVQAFEAAAVPLRFVGGAVRDALMDKPVKDVDACTPAEPERVIELLSVADIEHVPTGITHGTITAIIDKKPYEITTLRKDVSCDGRHADVVYTDDWEEDAKRRDFTMNALYCVPDGTLHDYVGGLDDLRAGVVRFIGNPSDRIKEDALRILRYFRFLATHGTADALSDAVEACTEHHSMIDDLSGERIQHEMAKLLSAPHVDRVIAKMYPDIMQHLIPRVSNLDTIEWVCGAEEALHIQPDAITRLAAFIRHTPYPEEALDRLRERWKLANVTHKKLHQLMQHELIETDALESTMRTQLRHLGQEQFIRMLVLSWRPDEMHVLDVGKRLAYTWKSPEFPISGADLQALGYASGPELGDMLRTLEALWENADYTLTKEALIGIALSKKPKA
ncbi:MAG: CCA tRNA nucleotidyltransferase [Rickettsiales bacterium]|nr:CCA tRNA nucleotidyltransferase [Rickettsiales bacterium]